MPNADRAAKVLHVKADGTVDLVDASRTDISDIQQLVGGWVEATYGDGWAVMYDEEGGPKGYPPNMPAALLMSALGAARMYVGDVVFIGLKNDDTANVPQHIVDKAKEIGIILDVEKFEDYTGE
jgi:hypothetical protein